MHFTNRGGFEMNRRLMVEAGLIVAFLSVVLFSFITTGESLSKPPKVQQLSASQDHAISLSEATTYTGNYRKDSSAGSIKGEFFGMNAIKTLLDQQGAIGMRIYYGKKDDGTPVLVIVAVNEDGTDMANGTIDERGYPCPPVCDGNSPLSN